MDSKLRELQRRADETGDVRDHRAFIEGLRRMGAHDDVRLERARRLREFETQKSYKVGDLSIQFINYAKKYRPEGYKTGIVFVYNAPEPEWDHPPYGMKGDNAEHDRLWRKYNREELVLQRKMIERALDAFKIKLKKGKTPAQRLPWNPYAGCGTCKCSKGYNPVFDLDGASFYSTDDEGNEYERYMRRLAIYVTRMESCIVCNKVGVSDFNSYMPCGHRQVETEAA